AALELAERRLDVSAETLARLAGRERPARAGEAPHERVQRLVVGLEKDLRQATRRHRADGVAVPPGVLGRDQALLAGHSHPHSTALGQQRPGQVLRVLTLAQVAAPPQQVVQLVGRARLAAELALDLVERARVDQLAQLLLAEQLAQQVPVERQRLRLALGRGRVVLVHIGGDVVEEQRGRVGRGRGGLDVDEVDLPRAQALEQPLQRGQVEDVLQALAIGLEHDRERRVAPGDLQQRLRLQALLPQRRALARSAARDQQRAAGVLAEARAEERGLAELLRDEILDLAGVEQNLVDGRRRVG